MGLRESRRQSEEKQALEKQTKDQQFAQNRDAAQKALEQLKRVDSAIEGGLNYNQYSDMMVSLKVETDAALRSFVVYSDNDSLFKTYVTAAMSDFLLARESWETSIKYSSVVSDTERSERLQKHWDSARDNIDKAERHLPLPYAQSTP
jgi:hypothetical protein